MRLDQSALKRLGLYNNAGLLRFGEALFASPAKLLILAFDASENSRKRALSYAKRQGCPVCETSQAELGYALGRDRLSAVCIVDPKAAKAFYLALRKGEKAQ